MWPFSKFRELERRIAALEEKEASPKHYELADRPQLTREQLKKAFDDAPNELRSMTNKLIDYLAEQYENNSADRKGLALSRKPSPM